MYEYLDYQVSHNNRFIVRIKENRRLAKTNNKLSDELDKVAACGEKEIYIPQRGKRKARNAKLVLSYTEVELKRPGKSKGSNTLVLNVIQCQEIGETGVEENFAGSSIQLKKYQM